MNEKCAAVARGASRSFRLWLLPWCRQRPDARDERVVVARVASEVTLRCRERVDSRLRSLDSIFLERVSGEPARYRTRAAPSLAHELLKHGHDALGANPRPDCIRDGFLIC